MITNTHQGYLNGKIYTINELIELREKKYHKITDINGNELTLCNGRKIKPYLRMKLVI